MDLFRRKRGLIRRGRDEEGIVEGHIGNNMFNVYVCFSHIHIPYTMHAAVKFL